jgi:shikimate dehydrogenase
MDLAGRAFDLVVNTTRLGLEPDDELPLELDLLDRVGAVVDLVYRGGATPFVGRARERGIRAADGTEMLLHQGAVAFERWWGRSPSLEVMRTAFQAFQGS